MPTKVTREQREAVLRLLARGQDRETIAAAVGVTPGQVSAISAHVKMGTYGLPDPEDQLGEIAPPVADGRGRSLPTFHSLGRASGREPPEVADITPARKNVILPARSASECVAGPRRNSLAGASGLYEDLSCRGHKTSNLLRMLQSLEGAPGRETRLSPILLGSDAETGEEVYWNPDPGSGAANPHVLILGESGFGKTYTIASLAAELAQENIVSIVFDYGQGFSPKTLPPEFVAVTNPLELHAGRDGVDINPLQVSPDTLSRPIRGSPAASLPRPSQGWPCHDPRQPGISQAAMPGPGKTIASRLLDPSERQRPGVLIT